MRKRLGETRIFWREFRQTFTSTGAVLPSGISLAKAMTRHVGPVSPVERVSAVERVHQGKKAPQGNEGNQTANIPTATHGHQEGHRHTASAGAASQRSRRILEVGPGTGPVTAQIIQRMGPRDTLDLVELNGRFVSVLQERLRHDPSWQAVAQRVQIHPLPIEELPTGKPYEVIISGLPLNNFSCEMVAAILERLHQLAATQAMLSFFEYVAVRKAKSLFCKMPQRRRLAGIEQILARQFAAWEIDRECIVANVPPAWVHHLRLPGRAPWPSS